MACTIDGSMSGWVCGGGDKFPEPIRPLKPCGGGGGGICPCVACGGFMLSALNIGPWWPKLGPCGGGGRNIGRFGCMKPPCGGGGCRMNDAG